MFDSTENKGVIPRKPEDAVKLHIVVSKFVLINEFMYMLVAGGTPLALPSELDIENLSGTLELDRPLSTGGFSDVKLRVPPVGILKDLIRSV